MVLPAISIQTLEIAKKNRIIRRITTMQVNREFKATLFSELFSNPDKLRELYNAVAGTNYDEKTPIEINTLENVFFKI